MRGCKLMVKANVGKYNSINIWGTSRYIGWYVDYIEKTFASKEESLSSAIEIPQGIEDATMQSIELRS